MASVRLAILSTHVIQHFAPLYVRLTQRREVQCKVFYLSRSGVDGYFDPGFGVRVAWDSDLLGGYEHEFLPGADRPIAESFWANDCSTVGEHIGRFSPSALLVYGYNRAVSLRALLWANRRRVPVLMFSDSELVHYRPGRIRRVKDLLLPVMLRRVSAFTTIGDNNEAYWRHYGVPAEKLFRAAYPTNEAAFIGARAERERMRGRTRAAWRVSPEDFVALFVGKLIERKRPEDLVRAVIQLAGEPGMRRKVVAVFAGDGSLRSRLEEMLSQAGRHDCVRFLGFVNQQQLPETYAAADVLAHPADVDPHPLTVTESAMVGLPVIVSDRVGCVGPTDTARPGANALVYPVGNINALREALRELANDSVRLRAMASATREVALDHGLDAGAAGIALAVNAVTRQHSSDPRRNA